MGVWERERLSVERPARQRLKRGERRLSKHHPDGPKANRPPVSSDHNHRHAKRHKRRGDERNALNVGRQLELVNRISGCRIERRESRIVSADDNDAAERRRRRNRSRREVALPDLVATPAPQRAQQIVERSEVDEAVVGGRSNHIAAGAVPPHQAPRAGVERIQVVVRRSDEHAITGDGRGAQDASELALPLELTVGRRESTHAISARDDDTARVHGHRGRCRRRRNRATPDFRTIRQSNRSKLIRLEKNDHGVCPAAPEPPSGLHRDVTRHSGSPLAARSAISSRVVAA